MKKLQLTLFAHSYWDVIPVFWGVVQCAYLIGMLIAFQYLPWWGNVLTGFFTHLVFRGM